MTMFFKSQWMPLLGLGVTAIVLSRTLFALFNDPEGPNLLIVTVMALVVYGVSLAVYVPYSSASMPKRLTVAVIAQLLFVTVLYFFLR